MMGVKKEYYKNGNICYRREYKNSIKHGDDLMYFSGSLNKVKWKTPYVDSRRHGIEYEYNTDGSIKSVFYYLYGHIASKEEYKKYTLIEQLAGIKEI